MTKFIYCLKDVKSGYLDPSVFVNDTIAIRSFSSALLGFKDSAAEIWNFSNDFELWCLGTIDTDNGNIVPEIRFVSSVYDLKEMLLHGTQKSV